MKDFKEFLVEEDVLDDVKLDESVETVAASVLGYSAAGLLVPFGATMIALGLSNYVKGLASIWRRIIRNFKSLKSEKPTEVVKEMRKDPKTQQQMNKINSTRREHEEELGPIYSAIESKNVEKAKEEFNKFPKEVQSNPEIKRIIIAEISKAFGPPIYYKSPGNPSYRAIKKILGINEAKAAAYATEKALKEKVIKEEK